MISKLRLAIIRFLLRFEPDLILIDKDEIYLPSPSPLASVFKDLSSGLPSREQRYALNEKLNSTINHYQPLANYEEVLIEKEIKK